MIFGGIMPRKTTSVSLDIENIKWIKESDYKRNDLINDLIERFRESGEEDLTLLFGDLLKEIKERCDSIEDQMSVIEFIRENPEFVSRAMMMLYHKYSEK